jgi:hypothetical protein
MAWKGTIRRPDGRPLGDRAAVKQAIEAAFPGVTYSPGPGGEVDWAALSSLHIPDDVMAALVSAPAPEEGSFRGEGFLVRFSFGRGDVVVAVGVEVEGEYESALVHLRGLAMSRQWVVEVGA